MRRLRNAVPVKFFGIPCIAYVVPFFLGPADMSCSAKKIGGEAIVTHDSIANGNNHETISTN